VPWTSCAMRSGGSGRRHGALLMRRDRRCGPRTCQRACLARPSCPMARWACLCDHEGGILIRVPKNGLRYYRSTPTCLTWDRS